MAYPGYPFKDTDPLVVAVWKKGAQIDGYDANMWRRDICGNAMRFDLHGKEGDYGWEVDHIYPRALGGPTELRNLQPLWWSNNRTKGDTYPWSCP